MGLGGSLDSRDQGPLRPRGQATLLEAGVLLGGSRVFDFELGARFVRYPEDEGPHARASLGGFAGVRIQPVVTRGRWRPLIRGGAQVGVLLDAPTGAARAVVGPHLYAGVEVDVRPGVSVTAAFGGDAWIAPFVITWAGTLNVAIRPDF